MMVMIRCGSGDVIGLWCDWMGIGKGLPDVAELTFLALLSAKPTLSRAPSEPVGPGEDFVSHRHNIREDKNQVLDR